MLSAAVTYRVRVALSRLFIRLRLALLFAGVLLPATDQASGQWSRVGSPGNQISAFLVKGDTIFGGHQQDVLRSTNGGTTWGEAGGLSTLAVSAFAVSGDTLFAVTNRARGCDAETCDPLPTIFRSTDHGATWNPVLDAVYGATRIQRTASSVLYANPDGALYRSRNGGSTWELVPVDTATLGLVEYVFAHGDTIYIDTRMLGLHRSTDGATWIQTINGLPGTAIFSMDALGSVLYAVAAGFGVYTSDNQGTTWTPINNGLSEPGSLHFVTAGDYGLFAASAESVFTLRAGTSSWNNVSGDLMPGGFTFIACLAATERHLLAGTNDGIWRAALADLVTSTAGETAPPAIYRVQQNYPNPFNPSTTITYDVPSRSHITISVFSLLGQNVATLLDQETEAGRHSVTWIADGFPSGIYLLRFSARPLSHPGYPVLWEGKMILTR